MPKNLISVTGVTELLSQTMFISNNVDWLTAYQSTSIVAVQKRTLFVILNLAGIKHKANFNEQRIISSKEHLRILILYVLCTYIN